MLSNNIEGTLNIRDKNMPIFHFDSKLSLYSFVNMHAGFDVDEASFVTPVSVEGNGYALGKERATFHLSGSIWLSFLCTHLIILLAVRPGCVEIGLRGGVFSCVWEAGCSCTLFGPRCDRFAKLSDSA